MTEWKLNMVEHGLSVAESFLVELMHNRVGPFAAGVVGGPFHRLCDTISLNHVPPGTKVPQAALLHAFKEAGWVDCGRLGSVDYPTKRHVFADPSVAKRCTKSDLRRMIETIASDDKKVVSIR